jgi:hypothetical protein
MIFGDSTSSKRVIQGKVPWHLLLLSAVLALSAFLDLSRLTSEGYGNVYYAATVKNMLDSWYNFFFVSYDAGFVSVDKSPLGFWIQATSAYLFGFHGWSILLPQALAGILCVALLYHLVRRSFGYPRKEGGEVDNGQLRAGSPGTVAIINLHPAALRLRYWSPLAFGNE